MYIPEFVCGVLATLAVEFAALVVATAAAYRKSKKRMGK